MSPTASALLGVLLGGSLGILSTLLATRMASVQAERNRVEARRTDWLARLAVALADIDTLTGRLTAHNVRTGEAMGGAMGEAIADGIREALVLQREVRRELRIVQILSAAGGDQVVAQHCAETERALRQFIRAAGATSRAATPAEQSTTDKTLETAAASVEAAVAALSKVLALMASAQKRVA